MDKLKPIARYALLGTRHDNYHGASDAMTINELIAKLEEMAVYDGLTC